MEYIIEVSNLYKTYKVRKKQRKENEMMKEIVAVNDMNFCVKKGEVFGILGPNGAGKTTTLRMLSTLIEPDKGNIMIKGKDSKDNKKFIQENIAFLTSELKLEGYFSADYMYNFFSDLYGVEKDVSDKRKQELFSKFGISDYSKMPISKLSTGMKQKVSIAVSLVNNPDILIYDEPTNGLDVVTSKIVIDYLLEQKANGKTIIISSHIFDLIYKICDRVCFVMNGKIVYMQDMINMQDKEMMEKIFFDKYNEIGDGNEI